jgi:predicted Zn-ribbon and HTH transcriptional regulator
MPPKPRKPVMPWQADCVECAYTAPDPIRPPVRCPKCGGFSWGKFVVPRSLLMNSGQREK